jgi:hypothetical protein
VPDKALIVHNVLPNLQIRGENTVTGRAVLIGRGRSPHHLVGGGGKGDDNAGRMAGGGGKALSCGAGTVVDTGFGAAGLGLATILRGFGFSGGGGGGGIAWSAKITGFGVKSGDVLKIMECSGSRMLSWIVWVM